MKKLLIAASISLSLNAHAAQDWSWFPVASSQTAGFTQTRENEDKTFSTREVTVTESAWVDSGGRYNCTEWSPRASDMPGGAAFNQTRDCEKHSFRDITYEAEGQLLHTRVEWLKEPMADSRTLNGGDLDYVTHTTEDILDWTVDGVASSCTEWTPDASTQGSGKPFAQNRDCDITETRSIIIYEHWASGKRTVQSENVESRNSTITEARDAVGTGSPGWIFIGMYYGPWQTDNGSAEISCNGFVYPDDQVSDFTVTRTCSEPQVRKVYEEYESFEDFCMDDRWGQEPGFEEECEPRTKLVEVEPETQMKTVTDSTRVDVVTNPWQNDGDKYDCTGWQPDPHGWTSSFTQTQSCKQNQLRRRYYQIYLEDLSQEDIDRGRIPGVGEIVFDTTDSQTITPTESRNVNVNPTGTFKSETSEMTESQARSYCLARRAGRALIASSGGGYIKDFAQYTYTSYVNGWATVLYQWTGDWQQTRSTVSPVPTCVYDEIGNP